MLLLLLLLAKGWAWKEEGGRQEGREKRRLSTHSFFTPFSNLKPHASAPPYFSSTDAR